MDPLSDASLFVIAIAMSVIAIFAVFGFYFLLKILSDIRVITKHMRNMTEEITDDVENIRENMKSGEEKIRSAVSFLNYFIPKKKTKKPAKKS